MSVFSTLAAARPRKTLQEKELRAIFLAIAAIFVVFLAVPMLLVVVRSATTADGALTMANFIEVLGRPEFLQSFANSFVVSAAAALVSVALAFLLSFTVNCTNVPPLLKKAIGLLAQLPMLLPTITYGFAIIYTFGRTGLLTRLLGFQLFDIYGFNGLLLGYVIYTLPTAFLLVDNSFRFIDKRFMIVSRVMGDSPLKTFLGTVLRPLAGALCVAFVQSFFLAFTDYGIPTSVGGQYDVVALELYNQMLGALPDFNKGAVIAVVMLIPSVASIILMTVLERFAIRYNKVTPVELQKSPVRDGVVGGLSVAVIAGVLSVFLVILIVPFIEMWPYRPDFTLDHVAAVFTDPDLASTLSNSLIVAVLTALLGCALAYAAALVTARSNLSPVSKRIVDSVSGAINAVPGMVLGIAFLFAFSGTPIQGTFVILIVCNVVRYFATPYQMMKDSLTKMNASWETTAKLMGDSWWKTIVRVVTPNAWPTILQVFGYYFVSAMVTISAVVFLTGAHTMVITTKISSLQHLAEFDSIFALSLGILVINLTVKGLVALLTRDRSARTARKSIRMRGTGRSDQTLAQGLLGQPEPPNNRGLVVAGIVVVAVLAVATFAGLARSGEKDAEVPVEGQVVIASNADEEALTAYRNALDAAGYEGQYVVQSFGTSELGGKLLAEGTNLEADVITMSSYYVDSAEDQNDMFSDLTDLEAVPPDDKTPAYRAPAQAQEGAIFYNTEVLDSEGLPVPTSLRDLADPVYEGMVSLPDITGSSTAWLLIQALVDNYGEAEAQEILAGIYRNACPYLSQSGSAPIKNVRAGEVAIGFGLRHQALADKAEGLPIEVVEPSEGTYSLTESVATVDKGAGANPLAQEMAATIIDGGRAELMQTYSKTLYEGEIPAENAPADQREFPEPLTVEPLERHQEISEAAKRAAAQ